MNHLLQVNAIVEWRQPEERKGEMARIVYMDPLGNELVVFPLPGDKEFPITVHRDTLLADLESGTAFIKPYDPFAPALRSDDELKSTHIQVRDRAWLAIEDIAENEPDIYDSDVRGRLVKRAASRVKTGVKSIYRYLRSYWRGGKRKNALLPDYGNCGGRGKNKTCNEEVKRGRPRTIQTTSEDIGMNITETDKALIRIAANEYYCKDDEKPVRKCYDQMIGEHYNRGYETNRDGKKIPIVPPVEERMTYGQFKYWLHKFLDIKKSIIARKGRRKFNLRHREVLKNSTSDAFGPGSIFQIDATIADAYLVSSLDRKKIIGRPVLYFVMDVFSRMIVGIYIGLSGPNYMGAAMALQNAASSKVEFCRRYGITIEEEEWPVASLPEYLVADRAELLSNHADQLVNGFGVEILNTPSWRADFKGILEQQFNRANVEVIHWSPGAVFKDSVERGADDPRLNAKLTIDEFTKIIIYMALNHNQTHYFNDYPLLPEMLADGVSPVPVDLWEWGLANRMGFLRSYTQQELLKNLLPSATASVTYQGIQFKGMYYTCKVAEDEAWFTLARKSGNVRVRVSYDPRCMDKIYIHPDHGKDLIECELLEKSGHLAGHREEDIELYWHLRKVQERAKDTPRCQGMVGLEALSQEVFSQASAETDAAWVCAEEVSRKARTGAIRENREEERQVRNVQEAMRLEPASLVERIPQSEQEDVEDASVDEHDSMMDLIRQNSL